MLAIIFVDDEPRILEGMQRMLRPMRSAWSMRFVDSGAAALAALEAEPADVVVTDMRMPGMSGADLLDEVKRRWPECIRIVLSGHADPGLVSRTVCTAHQFLNKPCDSDVLKTVVMRALRLRAGFTNPALRKLAGGIDQLPCLPAAYHDLSHILSDPHASVTAAGDVIARDPALALKLLQVVNSAFFGLRRQVDQPAEAASLLGLETLRAVVMSVHALQSFQGADPARMERIWTHSVAVASLARGIAKAEGAGKAVSDLAFVAGMMHDVGQVMLGARVGPNYAHLVDQAGSQGVPVIAVEERLLGTTHGQIGAYLLGIWGLSDDIVDAVAFHHQPSASPSAPGFGALAAVHVADVVLGDASAGLDAEYLTRCGLADRVEGWRTLSLQADGAAR